MVVEVIIILKKNMINKDKIKSAARGYSEFTYGTLEEHPLIEEAFKEGAKWVINEVLKDRWYTANKIPKEFN